MAFNKNYETSGMGNWIYSVQARLSWNWTFTLQDKDVLTQFGERFASCTVSRTQSCSEHVGAWSEL